MIFYTFCLKNIAPNKR